MEITYLANKGIRSKLFMVLMGILLAMVCISSAIAFEEITPDQEKAIDTLIEQWKREIGDTSRWTVPPEAPIQPMEDAFPREEALKKAMIELLLAKQADTEMFEIYTPAFEFTDENEWTISFLPDDLSLGTENLYVLFMQQRVQ